MGLITISSIVILSSLATGFGIYYGYSIKQDAWFLINGSGFSVGDQKLVIFVDIPTTGGTPNRYFIYEFVNNGFMDNWYFYVGENNVKKRIVSNPEEFDFIIIINSDSNGNENWDDFSVVLSLFNNRITSQTYNYNFGDNAANVNKAAVWQILSGDTIEFKRDGVEVADWMWDGKGAYDGYLDEDWMPLWDCIENYFNDGNEQEVENLLVDITFPAPI